MDQMEWRWVAALLAGYGFLKEVRPAEPYLTPFLTGPDKNFTADQVNHEMFPVSTYSNLALLVVVFLVTDWLRYKPVVVLQGASAVLVFAITAWGRGMPLMQVMQFLYGLMWAADVAYFTYMYAKVGRAHYGTVSATARVGFLLGRFLSGVLGQVAVSLDLASLLQLQYVTLAFSAAATLFAVALPAVTTSFYFHKNAQEGIDLAARGAGKDAPPAPPLGVEPGPSIQAVGALLWADCRDAYRQTLVVKWAAWWALVTAGQCMIISYVQILWQETVRENASDETLWNGGVEATYTLLGAAAVWLTARAPDYSAWGDAVMAAWALSAGAVTILASTSRSMALQYAAYVAFSVSYQVVMTIASAEVARRVREDAHALVFGINSFIALVLQTALTLAVTGQGGLQLDIQTQFAVFGGYFVAVGAVFVVLAAMAKCSPSCPHF